MTRQEKIKIATALALLEDALTMSEEDIQTLYLQSKEEAITNTFQHLKRVLFGGQAVSGADKLSNQAE